MTFVEVLEVTIVLSCFENFVKSKFILIGKSAITLYNSFGQNSDELF